MTAPTEGERTGTGQSVPLARSARPRSAQDQVWLVLHEPGDTAGPALAIALRAHLARRAASPQTDTAEAAEDGMQVLALSALTLRLRTTWTLLVEGAGSRWRLNLGDGRVLGDQMVAGVVNRLGPVDHGTCNPEAGYQAAEWSAMLLAWLHGLQCPVVNRPRPSNPYPRLHDEAWWRHQAALAGLPVWPGHREGAAPPVAPSNWLVIGSCALPARGAFPGSPHTSVRHQQSLCRLAQQSDCDLLVARGLLDSHGRWWFVAADPLPGAAEFAADGLDALAHTLNHPSAQPAPPRRCSAPTALARRAGVVAVLGRADEGPCRLLLAALKRLSAPSVVLDQRRLVPPTPDGFQRLLDSNGQHADWDRLHGLYLRPADTRRLGLGPTHQAVAEAHTRAWDAHAEWASLVVVNRLSAMLSNSSKPLQSQVLAALGFAIPPMLVTTSPAAVSTFEAEHGPLIYKSASGVRSIVRPLDAAARRRLQHVRHAPTMFQKQLRGTNVRVHVVGEAVFATEIDSGALDYRYAGRQGMTTELRATRLPMDLEGKCRMAAERLGLSFAGLDLMLADDGRVYCFEVNPSPGYSWYEDSTGQDISGALAALLCGRSH